MDDAKLSVEDRCTLCVMEVVGRIFDANLVLHRTLKLVVTTIGVLFLGGKDGRSGDNDVMNMLSTSTTTLSLPSTVVGACTGGARPEGLRACIGDTWTKGRFT